MVGGLGAAPFTHCDRPRPHLSDPLDGVFARGGALELGLALPWTLMMGAAWLARTIQDPETGQRIGSILHDLDRLPAEGYWGLPVAQSPVLRRHKVPDLGTIRMLSEPDIVSWTQVTGSHQLVLAPALNIGGWYDICLGGTLANYVALQSLDREARLVIGPWSHLESLGTR